MKETKVKEEITMGDLGNHIACPFCLEKDKQIKELEQKVQELQEVDNKRAFRLYCMLYDMLEEQDPKDVASRIDFMTNENYADICELYKTAKNLKQHDRELVKEVCEKIREFCENNKYRCNKYFLLYSIGLNVKLLNKNKEGQKETFYEFLDQIQKEAENE